MAYYLKTKCNTIDATKQFLTDSAPFGSIKRLRSDNDTEFTSTEFKSLLVQHKILHERSTPYFPHKNGTAERGWRKLFKMSRYMLIEYYLSHQFWSYAFLSATYICNRCYNRRLNSTPHETFKRKKTNVENMNIFGTICYAYVQEK